MRWLRLSLLVFLFASTSASAATLTPLYDERQLMVITTLCPGHGAGCQNTFETASPTGEFADFERVLSPVGAIAVQASSLSLRTFSGMGSTDVAVPPPPPLTSSLSEQASSTFDVGFSLDEAASVSLTGNLGYASSSGAARVQLCASSNCSASSLFDQSVAYAVGLPNDASQSFVFDQILPAGDYRLIVSASDTNAGHAFYDFVFSVPEPSALTLSLAGLAAIAGRYLSLVR